MKEHSNSKRSFFKGSYNDRELFYKSRANLSSSMLILLQDLNVKINMKVEKKEKLKESYLVLLLRCNNNRRCLV